jgi:hypothetical protein
MLRICTDYYIHSIKTHAAGRNSKNGDIARVCMLIALIYVKVQAAHDNTQYYNTGLY